jgi:hypothetical protein
MARRLYAMDVDVLKVVAFTIAASELCRALQFKVVRFVILAVFSF